MAQVHLNKPHDRHRQFMPRLLLLIMFVAILVGLFFEGAVRSHFSPVHGEIESVESRVKVLNLRAARNATAMDGDSIIDYLTGTCFDVACPAEVQTWKTKTLAKDVRIALAQAFDQSGYEQSTAGLEECGMTLVDPCIITARHGNRSLTMSANVASPEIQDDISDEAETEFLLTVHVSTRSR